MPPYYDSMIAKVIVRSETRATALEKMARLLRGAWIEGVDTNISLHSRILAHPEFIAGGIDTNFLTNLLSGSESAPRVANLMTEASHGVD